jgi:phospholipid transport system transporter-binding protein
MTLHSVTGELTFQTVPDHWRKSADLFGGNSAFTIDLSGVTRADSAGLALLIGWIRRAKQESKSIYFKNIPANLVAIARVTGVDAILAEFESPAAA